MEAGILINWNASNNSGTVRLLNSKEVQIKYSSGRTLAYETDSDIQITTSIRQPAGGHLKVPALGDTILVDVPNAERLWVYAEHFVAIAERRYASQS